MAKSALSVDEVRLIPSQAYWPMLKPVQCDRITAQALTRQALDDPVCYHDYPPPARGFQFARFKNHRNRQRKIVDLPPDWQNL